MGEEGDEVLEVACGAGPAAPGADDEPCEGAHVAKITIVRSTARPA